MKFIISITLALIISAHLMAQDLVSPNPKIYTTKNIAGVLHPNIDGVLEDSV